MCVQHGDVLINMAKGGHKREREIKIDKRSVPKV
jgi:hypothetical protein